MRLIEKLSERLGSIYSFCLSKWQAVGAGLFVTGLLIFYFGFFIYDFRMEPVYEMAQKIEKQDLAFKPIGDSIRAKTFNFDLMLNDSNQEKQQEGVASKAKRSDQSGMNEWIEKPFLVTCYKKPPRNKASLDTAVFEKCYINRLTDWQSMTTSETGLFPLKKKTKLILAQLNLLDIINNEEQVQEVSLLLSKSNDVEGAVLVDTIKPSNATFVAVSFAGKKYFIQSATKTWELGFTNGYCFLGLFFVALAALLFVDRRLGAKNYIAHSGKALVCLLAIIAVIAGSYAEDGYKAFDSEQAVLIQQFALWFILLLLYGFFYFLAKLVVDKSPKKSIRVVMFLIDSIYLLVLVIGFPHLNMEDLKLVFESGVIYDLFTWYNLLKLLAFTLVMLVLPFFHYQWRSQVKDKSVFNVSKGFEIANGVVFLILSVLYILNQCLGVSEEFNIICAIYALTLCHFHIGFGRKNLHVKLYVIVFACSFFGMNCLVYSDALKPAIDRQNKHKFDESNLLFNFEELYETVEKREDVIPNTASDSLNAKQKIEEIAAKVNQLIVNKPGIYNNYSLNVYATEMLNLRPNQEGSTFREIYNNAYLPPNANRHFLISDTINQKFVFLNLPNLKEEVPFILVFDKRQNVLSATAASTGKDSAIGISYATTGNNGLQLVGENNQESKKTYKSYKKSNIWTNLYLLFSLLTISIFLLNVLLAIKPSLGLQTLKDFDQVSYNVFDPSTKRLHSVFLLLGIVIVIFFGWWIQKTATANFCEQHKKHVIQIIGALPDPMVQAAFAKNDIAAKNNIFDILYNEGVVATRFYDVKGELLDQRVLVKGLQNWDSILPFGFKTSLQNNKIIDGSTSKAIELLVPVLNRQYTTQKQIGYLQLSISQNYWLSASSFGMSWFFTIVILVIVIGVLLQFFFQRKNEKYQSGLETLTTAIVDEEPIFWEHKDSIGMLVSAIIMLRLEREKETNNSLVANEKLKRYANIDTYFHDLKNPIAIMKGVIDNFERRISLPNLKKVEIENFTKDIILELDNFNSQLNSWGDVYINKKVEIINIIEYTQNYVSNKQRHFRSVQYNLNNKCSSEVVYIRMAKFEIESIFSNLIKNAVDVLVRGAGGLISITLSEATQLDQQGIRISIADNGPGIPIHLREDLLKKNVTGTKQDSTGIGLLIIAILIRGYKGKIFFETTPDIKEGTVFHVELPTVTVKVK